MRSFLTIVLAGALAAACSKPAEPAAAADLPATAAAGSASADAKAVLKFNHLEHDFGKIAEGEKVSHTFSFRNTSAEPVTIVNVKPSCGCTTPDYTKTAVAPGEEGFVTVQFDSEGRPGEARKSVDVFTDQNSVLTLKFTGEVVPKDTKGK